MAEARGPPWPVTEGNTMNRNHREKSPASPPVREMTQELYHYLLLDIWPGVATMADFGIKTQAHYGALQYAVQHHDVSPERLDDAMGNGPALTALVRPDNPYYGVRFQTPWDDIMVSIKDW